FSALWKLADALLGRYLPRRCRADEQSVDRVQEGCRRGLGEALRVGGAPDEHVGIQQESHAVWPPSQAWSSSSGRASKKAESSIGGMSPTRPPSTRGSVSGASNGTSRA